MLCAFYHKSGEIIQGTVKCAESGNLMCGNCLLRTDAENESKKNEPLNPVNA